MKNILIVILLSNLFLVGTASATNISCVRVVDDGMGVEIKITQSSHTLNPRHLTGNLSFYVNGAALGCTTRLEGDARNPVVECIGLLDFPLEDNEVRIVLNMGKKAAKGLIKSKYMHKLMGSQIAVKCTVN